MAKSFKYSVLDQFLKKSGIGNIIASLEDEEDKFITMEGAKTILIENDGDLEKAMQCLNKLEGDSISGNDHS